MCNSLFLLITMVTGQLTGLSSAEPDEEHQHIEVTNFLPNSVDKNIQQSQFQGIPAIVKDLLPCKCNPRVISTLCAGNENFKNQCYLSCVNAVRRRLNQSELKVVCLASCDTCETSSVVKLEQNHKEETHPPFFEAKERFQTKHLTETRSLVSMPEEFKNRLIKSQPLKTDIENDEQQQPIEPVPEIIRDLIPCKCNRHITNPVCAGDKNFQNRCYLACDNAVRRRLNRPEIKTVCFATCDSCKALNDIQQNFTKAASLKPEETQRKPYIKTEARELKPRQATNPFTINQQRRLFTVKLSEVLLEEGVPTNMNDLVPCKCNRLLINPLCAGEVNFKNQCYLACENAVRSRLNIEQLNVTCYAKCMVCDVIGPHTSSVEGTNKGI